MIVTLWQVDPEFRVKEELDCFIQEMNLEKAGVNTESLVIQGHPLFTDSTKETGQDSYFPKIGIEWESDEITDDISRNGSVYKFNQRFKKKIEGYVKRGFYEQPSSHSFIDILQVDSAEYVEVYKRHVISKLLITGWGNPGNTSKKVSQWLYMASQSVLPYVFQALYKKYRVTGALDGIPQTGIVNNQYSDFLYGFEIPISIRQIQTTFRISDDPIHKPKLLDLHMEGSRSTVDLNRLVPGRRV